MEKEFSETGPEGPGQAKESKEQDIAHLKEIIDRLYKIDLLGFHGAVVKKTDELRAVYPDCEDYRLYHLLVGSTPLGECPKYDFPGDDSIESFLEEQNTTMSTKDRS